MKKILVVTDEQIDFTTGCLGNEECAATVSAVVEVLEEGAYDKVYVTRDTHQENYLETQEGKRLPVVHCVENTPGWQIAEPVWTACVENYRGNQLVTLNKPTFGSLTLGQLLREDCDAFAPEDVEIHFVGVCTGICVISNVIIAKAAAPEARVCVIERACACVTPESHQTALAAMKTCQVDII